MKKEQLITTGVMFVVSVLVLIGVTIAWYSGNEGSPAATGMQMIAAEAGDIKIALTPGGADIRDLPEADKYADTGINELTINIEKDDAGNVMMAPGTFGKVTFYLTPLNSKLSSCQIVPNVQIQQTTDGEWYPTTDADEPDSSEASNTSGAVLLEELYTIIHGRKEEGEQPARTRHISFYKDEAGMEEIDEDTPYIVEWTPEQAASQTEKAVSVYWKWHYEYPFTEEENANLTVSQKRVKIDEYDAEDTKLGNNVKNMRFHFTFSTY